MVRVGARQPFLRSIQQVTSSTPYLPLPLPTFGQSASPAAPDVVAQQALSFTTMAWIGSQHLFILPATAMPSTACQLRVPTTFGLPAISLSTVARTSLYCTGTARILSKRTCCLDYNSCAVTSPTPLQRSKP